MENKYKELANGDGRFMQTVLFTYNYGNFYVSTAYRADGEFFETFAWSLDDNFKRDKLVGDATRGSDNTIIAMRQHNEICESLMKTGTYEYDNNNDVHIPLI